MKILSIGLTVAVVAGLFVSTGESKAPPASQVAVTVRNSDLAPGDSAPRRPSPRVARQLDDSEKDSLLGLALLVSLKRGAHSRRVSDDDRRN